MIETRNKKIPFLILNVISVMLKYWIQLISRIKKIRSFTQLRTMESKRIIEFSLILIVLSFARAKQQPFEACNMLIAVDQRLYDHFNQDINNVTSMAKYLVEKINEVYRK